MHLCGQLIPVVQKVTHLGHLVSNDLKDADDIAIKRGAFIGQANFILNTFKQLKSKYLYKIFTIYCMSFYGSQLWKLNEASLSPLLKSYNIALRKIFQLPYNSHRSIIYYLANGSSLLDLLSARTNSFINRCLTSCNVVVQTVAAISQGLASSTFGYNCVVLHNKTLENAASESESDWIYDLCQELMDCRDGHAMNGLSSDQNRFMLNYVSTA